MKNFLHLAASFVGVLLEATARPAPDSDKSRFVESEFGHSLDFGVLNYRTERLDNGTDPYGWYEHD